jgi:hypothetical protein
MIADIVNEGGGYPEYPQTGREAAIESAALKLAEALSELEAGERNIIRARAKVARAAAVLKALSK